MDRRVVYVLILIILLILSPISLYFTHKDYMKCKHNDEENCIDKFYLFLASVCLLIIVIILTIVFLFSFIYRLKCAQIVPMSQPN